MRARINISGDHARALTLSILFIVGATFSMTCGAATELKWYGHAAFKITTESGKVLLIDPWIDNPTNSNGAADLASITKADLILITHGHLDHVGNATEIALRTGARLVANLELGQALVKYQGFPAAQASWNTLLNIGGELSFFDGEVKVKMVPAMHTSGLDLADGSVAYAGAPAGYLISINNGPIFYDTGDTEFFSDMALMGRDINAGTAEQHEASRGGRGQGRIDVMLACIGGHFTMDPKGAAYATKVVGPREVIPMHYGANLGLPGTVAEFAAALEQLHVNSSLRQLPVGGTVQY
jgi:L-ascorbate metabolism protein UlaG (beta-lactamase superfamily)